MIYTSKTPLRLTHAHVNRIELTGAQVTANQRAALAKLLSDIDSQIGLSKFTAIYPFIGGTAASHALDVVGGNDITWNGTLTHNAAGTTGDGSTGYGDTGIASDEFSSDDVHLSVYQIGGTPSTNRMAISGVYASGPNNRLAIFSQLASGNVQSCIGQNCAAVIDDGTGLIAAKNDGTSVDLYANGSQIATAAHSASTFTSQTINLMREPAGNQWFDDGTFKFVSIGTSLTDDENGYLYTIVEEFQNTLFRTNNLLPAYVADVESAIGSSIPSADLTAISDLVDAIISIGEDKFEAVYPFYGGNAAAHAIDLMGSFDITWNGTLTHDANGVTPNGSSGYGATGFNTSSSSTKMSLNSTHYCTYFVENPLSGTGIHMGLFDGGLGRFTYFHCSHQTNWQICLNANSIGNLTAPSPGDGCVVYNRELSTHQDIYHRGTRVLNHSENSVALLNREVRLFGRNTGGAGVDSYVNDPTRFWSMGAGLSSAEITTLTNAVNAYQTALGRAVSS